MARLERYELQWQRKSGMGELQRYVATLANGSSFQIKRQEGGRRAKWAVFAPGKTTPFWKAASLGDAKAIASCEYHIRQLEQERKR